MMFHWRHKMRMVAAQPWVELRPALSKFECWEATVILFVCERNRCHKIETQVISGKWSLEQLNPAPQPTREPQGYKNPRPAGVQRPEPVPIPPPTLSRHL